MNDDPQMNGVTVAALRFAIEVAGIMGITPPPEWGKIANGLIIPYNATLGVHSMPVGPTGLPVITSPRSTSCPEDINYLSYPLGPSLNISATQTRQDMQYWSAGDRTCLENPGRTP